MRINSWPRNGFLPGLGPTRLPPEPAADMEDYESKLAAFRVRQRTTPFLPDGESPADHRIRCGHPGYPLTPEECETAEKGRQLIVAGTIEMDGPAPFDLADAIPPRWVRALTRVYGEWRRQELRAQGRTQTFEERVAQAKELGLWTNPKTPEQADRRRAELAALGFEDFDSDKWDKNVAALRRAKKKASNA